MRISISISEAELFSLVDDLAPIRVHFGRSENEEQWVQLTRPDRLGLVGGLGFRLETSGDEVEEGDLRRIPGFIQQAILNAVNKKLVPENTKTLWQFPDTLTQSFRMPKVLEPLESFIIESGGGQVSVTDELLTFSVDVDTRLSRFGGTDEDDSRNAT